MGWYLAVFILTVLFQYALLVISLPQCRNTASITNIRTYIDNHPESLSLPHGRAFLAQSFGVGYEYFPIIRGTRKVRKSDSDYPLTSYNLSQSQLKRVRGHIHLCNIPGQNSSSLIFIPKCSPVGHNISFAARFVGPELLFGDIARTSIYSSTNPTISLVEAAVEDVIKCTLSVNFPMITIPGEYRLEVYMSYLNEEIEPSVSLRNQPTQERVNLITDKNSIRMNNNITAVSLMGIGEHSSHVCERAWTQLNLDGIVLEPCFSKSIGCYRQWFLIQNNSLRRLEDWNVATSLGYSSNEVWQVRAAFLSSFPTGPVITLDEARKLPLQSVSGLSTEYLSVRMMLSSTRVLRYGERAWQGALLEGGPETVTVTVTASEDLVERNEKKNIDRQSNRQQEWKPEAGQSSVSSLQSSTSFPSGGGDYCISGQDPGRWVHEPRCQQERSNTNSQRTVGSSGRNERDVASDREAKDRECLHAQLPESLGHSQIQSDKAGDTSSLTSFVWRPYGCQLRHLAGPEFAECMSSSRVRFLAGFGDSLGDEQWSNLASLLSSHRSSNGVNRGHVSSRRHPIKTGFSFELICNNAVKNNNPNRYIHRATNAYGLTNCIDQYLKKEPIESLRNTTVILVTNFMALWMIREHSLQSLYSALEKLAEVHAYYANSLFTSRAIRYRRIFMSGTAIHGYRAAGTTPQRMERFNSFASQILSNAGWEVLDVYNMTLGRPDGTADGIHYRGGVSHAITDLLTTILCRISAVE